MFFSRQRSATEETLDIDTIEDAPSQRTQMGRERERERERERSREREQEREQRSREREREREQRSRERERQSKSREVSQDKAGGRRVGQM